MLVAFGIVFFILAKFGFPAITSMVEQRKRFIDDSLENAKAANARLDSIKAEGEALRKAAQEEQAKDPGMLPVILGAVAAFVVGNLLIARSRKKQQGKKED